MWVFIFIGSIIVAAIIADAIKKRAQLEIIRAAVEKGQSLDPAFVDKLLLTQDEISDNSPERVAGGLQIGSIMTLAVGIGLPLMGWLIPGSSDKFFRAMIGAGILLFCISAGLFVSSKVVLSRQQAADRKP